MEAFTDNIMTTNDCNAVRTNVIYFHFLKLSVL